MLSYSDDYREQLLQFLFPEEKYPEQLNTMIITRLPTVSSQGFSKMLFDEFTPQAEKCPSLLIKLPSTKHSNESRESDFALIKIQGNILQTIQTFCSKLDSLTGWNYLQIQNGATKNMFDYRSFHRTFIEYMRNIFPVICIPIHNINLKAVIFGPGSLNQIHLSKQELAVYLTLSYFHIKQEPFCKDWNNLQKCNEQSEIFEKISAAVGAPKNTKEDFYSHIQTVFGKITKKFSRSSNKHLHKMAPTYDNKDQTFNLLNSI